MATKRRAPARRKPAKRRKPTGTGDHRVLRYVGRHAAIGTWRATRWAGRHTVRAGAKVVQVAVLVPGGVKTAEVKQWRDDRAKYGLKTIVVECGCGCGERMPQHQVEDHLNGLTGPVCVPVPAGEQVLANSPPRRVWADAEVVSVNGQPVEEPLREPKRGEIVCRCQKWVGRVAAYPDHAVTCDDVYQLAVKRYEANQEWLRKNWPALADNYDPNQTTPATPVAGTPPSKELEVQEASKWSAGSSVLADPAIDPDAFEEEVPEFLRQVADGFNPTIEHFSALAEYLDGAQFDTETGQTKSKIHGALDALHAAQQEMAGAVTASEAYIASLVARPDFSKV